MIKKFIRLRASKEAITRVLLEFETWSEWLPTVQIKNIRRTGEDQAILDLTAGHGVMEIQQKLEISRTAEDSFRFRQISGWLKYFLSEWTLLATPQGVGTTLAITAEAEDGILIPKSMIHKELSKHLEEWGHALDSRARSIITPQEVRMEEEEAIPTGVKKILQAFQTRRGLEIWLLGKRYLLGTVRLPKRSWRD